MSHERFEVGEMAVLIYARYHEQHCPLEVRITTGLVPQFDNIRQEFMLAYGIQLNGFDYYALPVQLRKRRPPQNWATLCNLNTLGETGPAESPGCSTQELRSDAEVAARTGRLPSRTVEHCAGGRTALAARDWSEHV